MDTVLGITVSKRNPFEQLYACVCRYLSPSAISLVIAGLQAGPEISNNSPFCVLAKQFRRQTSIDAFKKCPINKAQNGISARQLRVFIMGTV